MEDSEIVPAPVRGRIPPQGAAATETARDVALGEAAMKIQDNHSARRAFTLIELLVVIAIIGVLAGFLLPAIAKAQWTARKSKCINQLHQFDLAIMSYRNSWEQQLPPWLSNLYPDIVSNPKLYLCPEDPSLGKEGGKPPWEKDAVQQFVETDDFEGSTADTSDPAAAAVQNHEIKGNSYIYEFCAAYCNWATSLHWPLNASAADTHTFDYKANYRADGIHFDRDENSGSPTWREAKEWSIDNIGPWTPIVRCFWHTGGSFNRQDMVLNLGAGTHHLYYSGTTGADDAQYGSRAWEYTGAK